MIETQTIPKRTIQEEARSGPRPSRIDHSGQAISSISKNHQKLYIKTPQTHSTALPKCHLLSLKQHLFGGFTCDWGALQPGAAYQSSLGVPWRCLRSTRGHLMQPSCQPQGRGCSGEMDEVGTGWTREMSSPCRLQSLVLMETYCSPDLGYVNVCNLM